MKTKIEWTEESWNPIRARNLATGGVGHFCAHASPGCKNCYAERMQPRYRNFVRFAAQDFDKVEMFLDDVVLKRPLSKRNGMRIFPCSMTDIFGEFVHGDWIDAMLDVMRKTPQHTYQVLTKRAERMHMYLRNYDLPGNVWIGVSVEDQIRAKERLPWLEKTRAAVRWVSIEPLLEEVDLRDWLEIDRMFGSVEWTKSGFKPPLDWGVVGGESGPKARVTTIGHIRQVVRQFEAAGVPLFVKQMGARPVSREGVPHPIKSTKGGLLDDIPEDLRVRAYPC